MAVIQIPNLPPAISLTGAEQMEAVQGGVSVRTTVNQIAFFTQNFPPNIAPSGIFCTNRQFRLALAAIVTFSPNAMVYIDNNMPADISDPVNIQWNHGGWVVKDDTLYAFTQSLLSYSTTQMLVLMANAMAYPL